MSFCTCLLSAGREATEHFAQLYIRKHNGYHHCPLGSKACQLGRILDSETRPGYSCTHSKTHNVAHSTECTEMCIATLIRILGHPYKTDVVSSTLYMHISLHGPSDRTTVRKQSALNFNASEQAIGKMQACLLNEMQVATEITSAVRWLHTSTMARRIAMSPSGPPPLPLAPTAYKPEISPHANHIADSVWGKPRPPLF